VRELRPGLWHWQAPHPEWQPGEPWDQQVSSYAIDQGDRLLLFDPIAPPSEIEELMAARETAIVLTAPWHERDTQSLLERHASRVYAPPPDTAEDLMQKFGITAEQAGSGSPDLAWLVAGDKAEWRPYAAGERLPLPVGVEAFPGREHNDLVLWSESHRTVISGDTLVDFGEGLQIPLEWLRQDVTREQVVDGLRPLLELPVELVLPTHGGPTDRAALERVLA
jgi:glyoxylase-like metal-dependent hydrolase (beta-lactamase superfamily II)